MTKEKVLKAIERCTHNSEIGLVINPYDLKMELGLNES